MNNVRQEQDGPKTVSELNNSKLCSSASYSTQAYSFKAVYLWVWDFTRICLYLPKTNVIPRKF